MPNLHTTLSDGRNEDHYDSSHRLLRRLRIALLIWLICFIATLIWFSLAT